MSKTVPIHLPDLYWRELLVLLEKERIMLKGKVEVSEGAYKELLYGDVEMYSTIIEEIQLALP